jgi:A/G-specific adenine glycosylase
MRFIRLLERRDVKHHASKIEHVRSVLRRIRKDRESISKNILEWGSIHSPSYPWRKTTDPYRVAVAEIMLRRTRADAVLPVYAEFLDAFPTFESLAAASAYRIQSRMHSLGMVSRAEKMREIAKRATKISPMGITRDEEQLFEIFGSGSRYTVNALRCFAFGERVAIFDVNVARILGRVFSIDFGKDAHKNELSWRLASLLLPPNHVKEYNWALLDLGRTVCKKRPLCEICPLNTSCDYVKKRRL